MCLGIPGQIIEITDASQLMAKVDVSGIQRAVNIACIVSEDHPAEACVGDWVLVHVGFLRFVLVNTTDRETHV